jgi:hypothetical protein
MELLTVVQPRVFGTVTPTKIVELFGLGEGTPPKLGLRAAEVVEGFYSFLGFTRLATSGVVRKGIARGVGQGTFGYAAGGLSQLGPDGRYQVPLAKVRMGTEVEEDEIDLESGFLMMPQAVPQAAPVVPPGPVSPSTGLGPTPPGPIPSGPTPPGPTPPPVAGQKVVELTFSANRDQLFTAWNAVANLADLAGKVQVSLRAESEAGFERGKLQNGVMEPLREADLIQ